MYDVAVETPPAFPPVSAIELRAFLRLNDTSEDALLGEFVAAATAQFEHETGRPVVATGYKQTFARWPTAIVLGKGGVTAVATVKRFLGDGSEETLTGWSADLSTPPARVRLASAPAVPTTSSGLDVCPVGVVRFTAGWAIAAVPPTVRHAVKLLAAHFYQHREAFTDQTLKDLPAGWANVCRMHRFGLDGDWGQ